MSRLLLSILFVSAAVSVQAQGPVEVKTNDGRIVILKPDGTWEYKRDAPRPPVPSANDAGQSGGTDSLPPNFAGHDARALYTQLSDLKKRLVKSEFETSAEYEKRAAQEKQKPVLGDLTVRDAFSLVVPNVSASYDADSQKMRFFLPVEKSRMAELYRSARIGQDKKTASNLEEVNLYSIEWGDIGSRDRQGIFFEDTGGLTLTERDFQQGFAAEVQLGVEEARRLKTASRAVAVVQFEEPYAAGSPYVESQLQVRLIDVYFFDPQTGRILSKVSRSGK